MTPSDAEPRVVAVLGLGAMGLPMAGRLAGRFRVVGFDPQEDRRRMALEVGVELATSARAAAQAAGVVLLAVRSPEQLRGLLFGADGIADALDAGDAVVLTSTVGVQPARDAARRLLEQGVHLVDAPLSGGPVRAGRGDLLIVVGGTPEARAAVEPVIAALGSTVTVVGDEAGDGQALKTVNQLLCGVHIAAAAEALNLADALGLDRGRALEALQAGAAGSFMLGDRGPRMLLEDADVLSRLDIFVKDLGIVGDAARSLGVATPVAAAAEQLFLLGAAQGRGADDDSSVIRVLAPPAD